MKYEHVHCQCNTNNINIFRIFVTERKGTGKHVCHLKRANKIPQIPQQAGIFEHANIISAKVDKLSELSILNHLELVAPGSYLHIMWLSALMDTGNFSTLSDFYQTPDGHFYFILYHQRFTHLKK